MKEPDPSLEDRFLPIPVAFAIPVFMAFAWAMMSHDMNGTTNKIFICGASFFYLIASLYSQISTGWAHDPSLRASWSRGSDYDAIYWLNFAINLAAALIFGIALVAFLLAA